MNLKENDLKISLIAAFGKNFELGKDNKLLWHIPEDLKSFKSLTLNHMVLMGYNTFLSLGKPLKNRVNLVLSKTDREPIDGVKFFKTADEAVSFALNHKESELFVIGGATVYDLFLDVADTAYISKVDWEGAADCYFPVFDFDDYQIMEYKKYETLENIPAWEFYKLSRKKRQPSN